MIVPGFLKWYTISSVHSMATGSILFSGSLARIAKVTGLRVVLADGLPCLFRGSGVNVASAPVPYEPPSENM